MAKAKSKRNVGDDLFQAILDDPDNDTPRLVYADWLEENGNADRAEFIRVQCELATIAGDHPSRRTLMIREDELLVQHGETWRQDVAKWARRNSRFSRGFIASIRCTPKQFLKGGNGLVQRTPLRELSSFYGNSQEYLELASCPAVGRIQSIRGVHPGHVLCLAGSPHLGSLQELAAPTLDRLGLQTLKDKMFSDVTSFRTNGLSVSWPEMSESEFVSRLQTLHANEHSISIANLEAFLHSPNAPKLRELGIRLYQHLEYDVLKLIGNAPSLANLNRLTLTLFAEFTPPLVRTLAESPCLKNLTDLTIIPDWVPVSLPALKAFSRQTTLKRLTVVAIPPTWAEGLPCWHPQWKNTWENWCYYWVREPEEANE